MKLPAKAGPLSKREFDDLFQSVCNWRWGPGDARGTLNFFNTRTRRDSPADLCLPNIGHTGRIRPCARDKSGPSITTNEHVAD